MEVAENNGRKLKEVFSIDRKEFDEELKSFDDSLGMEYLVDDDTTYKLQDLPHDDSTLPNDTPSTTPSEKGTTIKPVEKGTAMGPSQKGPTEISNVKRSADGSPPGHGPPLGAGHAPLPVTEHGPPPGHASTLGAEHAPPPASEHEPLLGHAPSLGVGHAPPPASEYWPPSGNAPSQGAGHASELGPPPGHAPSLGAGHAPPPASEHRPPPGHAPSLGAGHAPPPASEHRPPPGAGHAPPPSKKRPTIKPLAEKPTFKTPDPWGIYRHIDHEPHPYRPSWMWISAEKIATVRPYYLPPTKAINEWNPHDHPVNHFDWGPPKFKFVFVTEPPPVHHNSGAAILKIIFGVVGCLVACLILASYAQRSKRTRRGRVLAVDAGALERRILDDNRLSEPGEPNPVNNDLPPPYYECTLYSIKKCVGDVPPPYTVSEDTKQQYHKQLTDQCTNGKNNIGFYGFNENFAPEMRTELVFDNGRIVERPSLTKNETGTASNDNVEQQSTRHADFNDKVVYTDETGKCKINK